MIPRCDRLALGVLLGLSLTVGRAQVVAVQPEVGLALLTNVVQVRNLSREEAARGYPVRVRGVITYHDPEEHFTFVQDETAGIYLYAGKGDLAVSAGQLVVVEGVSAPGDWGRVVANPRVEVQSDLASQ